MKMKRKRITRRMLLKAAPVAGVGATAAALTLANTAGGAETQARGTCRICTMHCSIIATSRGGKLVRVEGDPASNTHGFICHHGYALKDIVHAKDRLRTPLKHGRAITWDRALTELAERLAQLHPRSALAVQTGWPFVRHPLVQTLRAFARAYGTPNLATVASLCESSARMGHALVAGGNLVADLRGTKALLVWGANPPISSPLFTHLVDATPNLIVVDPTRTELADRAKVHLAPRPGTDGALALGMLRLLIEEGLYDASVQAEGFDELRAYLAEWPLARVRELTGVAEADVERAVRLYAASKPGALWDGLGVEHHENGVQTVRAITSFVALCGNVGVKGGCTLEPAQWHFAAPPLPGAIGERELPVFHHFNQQASAMLFPAAIARGELRALMLFGSNALVTSPNLRRDKLELLVSVDPFLTETGRASDYVLPASTFAEADGLVATQHGTWSDERIIRTLADKLGLGDVRGARPTPISPSGKIELASALLRQHGLEPLPRYVPAREQPTRDFPLYLITGPRTRQYINSQFRPIARVALALPRPFASVHPDTARALNFAPGRNATVVSPHGRQTYALVVDDRIHRECVVVPAGWERQSANALTDPLALDPISGFPAFRSLTCRLEPS